VFELFSKSYEEIFQKKIDYFLLDMETMVQKEPQAVLSFNRFVSMTKEVMREFNFEIMAIFKIENNLKDLFPKYMQFVEQNINTSFEQMQHSAQGFLAQENQVVEQFVSS